MPGTVLGAVNSNMNKTACLPWNKLQPTEKDMITDEQKLLLRVSTNQYVTTTDKAINLTYGKQGKFHTKKTLFDLCLEDGLIRAKKGNFFE